MMRDLEMSVLLAATRKELNYLLREPAVIIMLFAVPLFLVLMLGSSYESLLLKTENGLFEVGYEFAVPGFGLLFSYFIPDFFGRSMIEERTSGTWERQRQLHPSVSSLLIGKAVPYSILAFVQICTILLVGFVFLGLSTDLNWGLLLLLIVSISLNILGVGLLVAAYCPNQQVLTGVSNLVALGFGAIGGALVPLSSLPSVLQSMSYVSPHRYAMACFDQVLRNETVSGDFVINISIILVMAVLLIVIAAFKFARTST